MPPYIRPTVRSMADEDRCPECHGEDFRIEGFRDLYPPDRDTDTPMTAARPIARSFWLKCENCGNLWFAIRKLTS